MSAWRQISGWKGTLLIAGLVILGVSTWYTTYLARKLSEGERSKVELYERAQREINKNTDPEDDVTFEQDIILSARDIPVILTDLQDNIMSARAFGC